MKAASRREPNPTSCLNSTKSIPIPISLSSVQHQASHLRTVDSIQNPWKWLTFLEHLFVFFENQSFVKLGAFDAKYMMLIQAEGTI